MVIFQEWFTEQWTFGFKICECFPRKVENYQRVCSIPT